MAHNAFVHGGIGDGTAWPTDYVFTQLDLQTLDQRQFESINGDLGGTWAPSSLIIIGGSGLQVTGDNLDVTSPARFHGGVVIDTSDLAITAGGSATFTGNVTIAVGGATTINQVATFGGAAIFSVGLASNGVSLFTAAVTMNTTLHVLGAVTCDANVTFAGGGSTVNFNNLITQIGGSLNINGVTTLLTSGHIRKRVAMGAGFGSGGGTVEGSFDVDNLVIGPGSNATISADIYIVGATLTADHTWRMASGSAGQECWVSIRNNAIASHVLTILDSAGTPMVKLQKGGGATHPYEAVHLVAGVNGAWVCDMSLPGTATGGAGLLG